jgi:hypothetical protein
VPGFAAGAFVVAFAVAVAGFDVSVGVVFGVDGDAFGLAASTEGADSAAGDFDVSLDEPPTAAATPLIQTNASTMERP